MAAEPELGPAREALGMAAYHDGQVQSHVMQAGILLSAWEGKIPDDEVPLMPPGDPEWFRQAAQVLDEAIADCDRLKVQLLAARLRVLRLS